MNEKHDAARRLLQAAQEMQALLTPETDGTCIWQLTRTVVSNAQAIEMLTRPETPPPDDYDEDEDEEEDT